jgi:hypothetical protein
MGDEVVSMGMRLMVLICMICSNNAARGDILREAGDAQARDGGFLQRALPADGPFRNTQHARCERASVGCEPMWSRILRVSNPQHDVDQ